MVQTYDERIRNPAEDPDEPRDPGAEQIDGGRRFPWDDNPIDRDLGRPVHADREPASDRESSQAPDSGEEPEGPPRRARARRGTATRARGGAPSDQGSEGAKTRGVSSK
jgi:hypothetical protein